jgi:hypothetical protein
VTCSYKLVDYNPVYFVDGVEVDEKTYRKRQGEELRQAQREREMQAGRRFRCALTKGDEADWSKENSGRGRYCGQLGRFQNDPSAWARSRHDLINKAKQRGLKPENTRDEV